MKERLQKIIAQGGITSRRGAEELILSGRVRLNGKIVKELGVKADAHKDKIEVDGKRVVREKKEYFLFHKPREVVCTLSDPEGRPALDQFLKKIRERVFPVGRLDYHTSGALLLTNDGKLSDALLRPKANIPKVYIAKIRGSLSAEDLSMLRNGVRLDDGYKTRPADVIVLREDRAMSWLQITLREGKNRQVHRMLGALGYFVMRLSRSSFAGIDVQDLRPGEMRELKDKELQKLKKKLN